MRAPPLRHGRAARAVLLLLGLAFLPGLRADLIMQGGHILNRQSAALTLDLDANGTNDLAFSPNLQMGLLTLSPGANLHVAGNVLVQEHLLLGTLATAPVVGSGQASLYALGGNLWYGSSSGNALGSGGLSGVWSASSGNIFFTAGRVGIGTTSPSANLQVSGNMVVSGQLLLANGSNAWPSLAFTSNLTTGLYLGAAGNICLAVNGSQRLSLVSGNLCLQGLVLPLDRRTTTASNVFLGVGTGSTGYYARTAVGSQASAATTVGNGYTTVAIGYQAFSDTGGGNGAQTAVGYKAGKKVTAAGGGPFIGARAGVSASGRAPTMAFGADSFQAFTDSDSNGIFVGYRAGCAKTTSAASAVGADALRSATTATLCTAMGYGALQAMVSGTLATAFGSLALAAATGSHNTAAGSRAGAGLTTGANNTLVGSQAGAGLTTGANNVLIGFQAGDNLTTGGNNIVIGAGQDAPSPTGWGQLNIGGVLGGNLQSGRIGIGTLLPSANLQVNGNVLCTDLLPLGNAIYTLGSSAAGWNAVYATNVLLASDQRLKTDIRALDYGLDEVLRLRPVRFAWREDGGERIGFLAQEVAAVLPEAVAAGDGPRAGLGLRAGALAPVLVQACAERSRAFAATLQDLHLAIREEQAAIAALEREVARLQARQRHGTRAAPAGPEHPESR